MLKKLAMILALAAVVTLVFGGGCGGSSGSKPKGLIGKWQVDPDSDYAEAGEELGMIEFIDNASGQLIMEDYYQLQNSDNVLLLKAESESWDNADVLERTSGTSGLIGSWDDVDNQDSITYSGDGSFTSDFDDYTFSGTFTNTATIITSYIPFTYTADGSYLVMYAGVETINSAYMLDGNKLYIAFEQAQMSWTYNLDNTDTLTLYFMGLMPMQFTRSAGTSGSLVGTWFTPFRTGNLIVTFESNGLMTVNPGTGEYMYFEYDAISASTLNLIPYIPFKRTK